MTAAPERVFRRPRPDAPPAVWAAFERAGRWKNGVLVGQQLCILVLLFVALSVAKSDPEVVLVAPDGQGTFVHRSQATRALLQFLNEQRQAPSELTVLAFTRRFVKATLQVNSTTFAEDWREALGLMAAPLRARLSREALDQKLVEANQLLQVRTRLGFDDVAVVEQHGSLFHVRARLQRERSRLFADGAAPVRDALQVELVLGTVRRTAERPDGLEVVEWRVAKVAPGADAGTAGEGG